MYAIHHRKLHGKIQLRFDRSESRAHIFHNWNPPKTTELLRRSSRTRFDVCQWLLPRSQSYQYPVSRMGQLYRKWQCLAGKYSSMHDILQWYAHSKLYFCRWIVDALLSGEVSKRQRLHSARFAFRSRIHNQMWLLWTLSNRHTRGTLVSEKMLYNRSLKLCTCWWLSLGPPLYDPERAILVHYDTVRWATKFYECSVSSISWKRFAEPL